MPHPIGLSLEPPKVPRYGQSKLSAPASNGLVADLDSAFSEQILDVAQAQREPEIESGGMLNYLWWEPVALVGNGFHVGFPSRRQPQCGDRFALE